MRAFLLVGVGLFSLTAACAPLSKRTHYERWREEMVRIHAEEAAEEAAEAKAKGSVGIGVGGVGVHTGTSTPATNYVAPGGAPPPPSRVIRPSPPPPPPPPPDDAVY